jgi:hypothetical protein
MIESIHNIGREVLKQPPSSQPHLFNMLFLLSHKSCLKYHNFATTHNGQWPGFLIKLDKIFSLRLNLLNNFLRESHRHSTQHIFMSCCSHFQFNVRTIYTHLVSHENTIHACFELSLSSQLNDLHTNTLVTTWYTAFTTRQIYIPIAVAALGAFNKVWISSVHKPPPTWYSDCTHATWVK